MKHDKHLQRDPYSQAVLTVDNASLEAYKARRSVRRDTLSTIERINSIEARIKVIEAFMRDFIKG